MAWRQITVRLFRAHPLACTPVCIRAHTRVQNGLHIRVQAENAHPSKMKKARNSHITRDFQEYAHSCVPRTTVAAAEDYPGTHEGKCLPVAHCLRGSNGWQLAPEIEAARRACPGAEVVEKEAFGSVQLAHALAREAASHGCAGGRGVNIELCGLCTDICVVSNALLLRAALPEAEMRVQSRLCAGVTQARHEAALETMRACHVEVI